MSTNNIQRLGVLTSGGDAPGMNAAVRAVVRTALQRGVDVYAIYEGYQGMVDGGERIRKMQWESVGGIMQQGGTITGTARCPAFRSRDGRMQAAQHLLEHAIDRLVVIGGDGSLTGANLFRQEWPELLAGLVADGRISHDLADRHPQLTIVGVVGSIDNDMHGTDLTIGADTALHRIAEAIDAISSTAASHQRSFVVEVMGRNCGYLALMSALATGADWVLIPESPPEGDNWEARMCDVLQAGRAAGRRRSIVIVAEGARDRRGQPITSEHVRRLLEERLGEDTRVTILGHVQRGGAPSAIDRNLGTLLGHAAAEELLAATSGSPPMVIGLRGNRITRAPLQHCLEETHAVAAAIAAHDYDHAMDLRGEHFKAAFQTQQMLVRAMPRPPVAKHQGLRLAVMHAGAPAPGMNTAVRAAVRLGIAQGHTILGVHNGFPGLISGDINELDWKSVTGWGTSGGAGLGTNRKIPGDGDLYPIARAIEAHNIQGLLVIGGWAGYQTAYRLYRERTHFPVFNIPIICLPATIDNDLSGTEVSIGADTALNNIMDAVDKIKQSAVAYGRCFVVEVMGRSCGYLALMSGLATGAERVYLPEEGVTLPDLETDLANLLSSFQQGKRLSLMIRNENAGPVYSTDFIRTLFEAESGGQYDVRYAVLGHLQQGGNPTPADRIQAIRLAAKCLDFLINEADNATPAGAFIGVQAGEIQLNPLEDLPRMMDEQYERPKEQWWLDLRPIARALAQPAPRSSRRKPAERSTT